MPSLGLGLGLHRRSLVGGLDSDVKAFASESGATDLDGLDNLVKYLKDEGIYDNFVIYPMKSAQNAGSGATVYSLGGLTSSNASLVNSPTWGSTGITFDGTTQYGTIPDFIDGSTLTAFDRFTINIPQGNDDTILGQWDTGANKRSWFAAMVTTGNLVEVGRDSTGNFSGVEIYTTAATGFDNVDVTGVFQWVDGGGRSVWADKSTQSLTLATGSPQTSRYNSDGAISIMAGLTSGSPQRHVAGLQTAVAISTGSLTTSQRETITDYINAL